MIVKGLSEKLGCGACRLQIADLLWRMATQELLSELKTDQNLEQKNVLSRFSWKTYPTQHGAIQYMYEYGLIAGCGARRAVRFGWEGGGWQPPLLTTSDKIQPPTSKFHPNSASCVSETVIIFQELTIYFNMVLERGVEVK